MGECPHLSTATKGSQLSCLIKRSSLEGCLPKVESLVLLCFLLEWIRTSSLTDQMQLWRKWKKILIFSQKWEQESCSVLIQMWIYCGGQPLHCHSDKAKRKRGSRMYLQSHTQLTLWGNKIVGNWENMFCIFFLTKLRWGYFQCVHTDTLFLLPV